MKKKEPKKTKIIQVRLTEDEYIEFDKFCKDQNFTKSGIVRATIDNLIGFYHDYEQ